MKRLLHIVRKDVARLRLPWLLWLGLIAAKIGLGLVFIAAETQTTRDTVERLHPIVVVVECTMTYLLAAWLVLEDAPMRAGHYSHTRPISRRTLLAAKALGALLLLGLAPVLTIYTPWWWYSGFGAMDWLQAAVLVVASQLAFVGPAFLVASLVDSFRRFLLWTPVLMGALVAALLIPSAWIQEGLISGKINASGPDELGIWQTRFVIVSTLLAVGGALLVFFQFVRRRPLPVLGYAAAGLGVAGAVMLKAPWNLWPEKDPWSDSHAELASDVSVRLESVTVPTQYPPRVDFRALDLHWSANSASSNLLATPREIRHRLTWPETGEPAKVGTEFGDSCRDPRLTDPSSLLATILPPGTPPPPDSETEEWYAAWRKKRGFTPMPPTPPGFASSFLTSREKLRRAQVESPTLHARIRFSLLETILERNLPLAASAGAFRAGRGRQIEIDRTPSEVSVRGATESPNP